MMEKKQRKIDPFVCLYGLIVCLIIAALTNIIIDACQKKNEIEIMQDLLIGILLFCAYFGAATIQATQDIKELNKKEKPSSQLTKERPR